MSETPVQKHFNSTMGRQPLKEVLISEINQMDDKEQDQLINFATFLRWARCGERDPEDTPSQHVSRVINGALDCLVSQPKSFIPLIMRGLRNRLFPKG